MRTRNDKLLQMEMDPKHDAAFIEILREDKNIQNFLNSFFGFLYRCTDFFVESAPDQQLGFPPGVAEKLVVQTLREWQLKAVADSANRTDPPPAIKEVTVASDGTTQSSGNSDSSSKNVKKEARAKASTEKAAEKAEFYNGASYENYGWSQTIGELDVLVRIPEEVRSGKQVRVELTAEGLEVAVLAPATLAAGETADAAPVWTDLVKGRFSFKVKSSESCWCLEPGKHISLHLEKAAERWWESLLEDEPRIELSKIDCTRNLEEMAESEQMKVEELMWNQRRKLLGQPTSDQIRMEQILKQAWNADGSPFKGTEYDPSVLKFN